MTCFLGHHLIFEKNSIDKITRRNHVKYFFAVLYRASVLNFILRNWMCTSQAFSFTAVLYCSKFSAINILITETQTTTVDRSEIYLVDLNILYLGFQDVYLRKFPAIHLTCNKTFHVFLIIFLNIKDKIWRTSNQNDIFLELRYSLNHCYPDKKPPWQC